jgi:hypothetical protein
MFASTPINGKLGNSLGPKFNPNINVKITITIEDINHVSQSVCFGSE